MRPIRNSAKAVIIKDGKLLCTRNEDQFGTFYLLPGGGQEAGEALRDTLVRECLEEISVQVTIGDILFVREYIGKNHEFAAWDGDIHQIEYMFACTIPEGCELKSGSIPDSMQTGVEWLDIETLTEYRIYPAVLACVLGPEGKRTEMVYLGDVN